MLEETTTDVTSDVPVAGVSEDATGAPASANQDVMQETAQAPLESTQEEAVAPFKLPETDDDLKGQENNPHVQALIQLRHELRARDKSLDGLKPLETYAPLKEYGDAETLKQRLDLFQGLSTPVVENGQVKIDPLTGYPQTTAKPFLEQLGPQMVYKLIADAVTMPGQSGESIIREILRHNLNLDPDNLEDSGTKPCVTEH
jgi:hypothetical protein